MVANARGRAGTLTCVAEALWWKSMQRLGSSLGRIKVKVKFLVAAASISTSDC